MKNMFQNNALNDTVDNWLKEEMKLEARVSVWDFDDNASYLDKEHKEKCEAKHLQREHQKVHETNERELTRLENLQKQAISTYDRNSVNTTGNSVVTNTEGNVIAGLFSIIFIFIVFVFIFVMLGIFAGF